MQQEHSLRQGMFLLNKETRTLCRAEILALQEKKLSLTSVLGVRSRMNATGSVANLLNVKREAMLRFHAGCG